MGQAKRRVAARLQSTESIKKVDIPRLAGAIRKLALAASDKIGGDCFVHAAITQALLARLGVEANIKIGFSAWRVGNGLGDVLTHCPLPGMPSQPGVAFHVWLEIGSYLFDPTMYQVRMKCLDLDRLDGGTTNVEWCPDFLYCRKSSVSSFRDVQQLGAGLYYYAEERAVSDMITAASSELDQGDVELAWTIYNNPDLLVFGPNNGF